MPRTYLPYSGNLFEYGYGPEHLFFGDQPASQAPAPVVVPSWAAIEGASPGPSPGNDQTAINNMGGGEGSGGFSIAGGYYAGEPNTPANFDSRFGEFGGLIGGGVGMATGIPLLGTLAGAAGEAVDLSRHVDVLRANGIEIDPDYASAALAGATSLPFGWGNLFGDSARQQSENARRGGLAMGLVEPGRYTDPSIGGGNISVPQDIREALDAALGRPAELPELETISALYRSPLPESQETLSRLLGIPNPAAPPAFLPPAPVVPPPAAPSEAPAPTAGTFDPGVVAALQSAYDQQAQQVVGDINGWSASGVAGGGGYSDPGAGYSGGYGGYDGGYSAGEGGSAAWARGGPISGPGTGLSDSIPATVDGVEPAALSSGEHVVPADVVSMLGDGDTEAGHRRLSQMFAEVRKQKTGTKRQAKPLKMRSIAQLAA